jgi:hypothetical protein
MICTWIAELMLHRIVALEFLSTATTADVTITKTTSAPLKVKSGQHQLQPKGIQSQDGGGVQVQGRTGEGVRIAALLAFKEFLRKYKYVALRCVVLHQLRWAFP